MLCIGEVERFHTAVHNVTDSFARILQFNLWLYERNTLFIEPSMAYLTNMF